MKWLNTIKILILLSYISCTNEPKLNTFTVSISNSSIETVNIETFFHGSFVNRISLVSESSVDLCTYQDENFRGLFFSKCNIDSLIIRFTGNKGFISTKVGNGDFNFSDGRNPLLPNGGFEISANQYTFTIKQEDYQNAFDLP
jgi:hypothetical protein